MLTFTTTICVQANYLPSDFVKALGEREGDLPYEPTDHVDDLRVEVTYDPGVRVRATFNHPDESEDPEILSCKIAGTDYDILMKIPQSEFYKLVGEAWEDQVSQERERALDYCGGEN